MDERKSSRDLNEDDVGWFIVIVFSVSERFESTLRYILNFCVGSTVKIVLS